jgi:dipeptidyl aminopeptidase/acylaminoacyl peptidase
MKNVLCLLGCIGVVAVLTLAACGGPGTTSPTSPSPKSSVPSYTDAMSEPSPSAPRSATPLPAPTVAGTIAFCNVVKPDEGGDADIYTVRTDGTRLTRLTHFPGWEESPSWSPDVRKIAFTRYPVGSTDGGQASVWVMNADGSGERRLTSDGCTAPSWSPDGTTIAFTRFLPSGAREIFVMNADGSGKRAVVRGESHQDELPVWTPDGRILFRRDSIDLFAVNPDGSGLERLLKDVALGGYSASPDGSSLAYDDTVADAMLVRPIRGGSSPLAVLKPLTTFVAEDPVVLAAWRPGGTTLAIATYDPGSIVGSPIYVVNADGSGLSSVPGVTNAMDPAWRAE